MKQFVLLVASIAAAALLNGCGSSGSSADAPPDLKVIAGDSVATISWTAAPDVDYWLFYAPGSNVTTSNWLSIGGLAIQHVTSPYTVGGLVNGTTYSFTMNARKGGGPGGPGAVTQVITPRLAGSNWTVGTPLGTTKLNGASSFGTTNVFVGSGGAIYSQISGAAPTVQTNPAAPADLNAVVHASLGYVAVGATGTIVFSTDGATWVAKTSGTAANLFGVTTPGAGSYVAVGAGGATLFSGDGSAWTVATSATTKTLYAATYGAGRYVAVGANGAVVTSTDGSTWQAVTVNTTSDLRGVAFGLVTTFTVTGTTTTTTQTNTFVAVGTNGTLLTSTDGLTWTLRTPISTKNMNAVTYGGQFVAVGDAGSIYSSADGITWLAQSSGTLNDLNAITRTNSGYTAVGAAGTLLTSF